MGDVNGNGVRIENGLSEMMEGSKCHSKISVGTRRDVYVIPFLWIYNRRCEREQSQVYLNYDKPQGGKRS